MAMAFTKMVQLSRMSGNYYRFGRREGMETNETETNNETETTHTWIHPNGTPFYRLPFRD